jgi:uncharacterized RDD family membrane protein YckC
VATHGDAVSTGAGEPNPLEEAEVRKVEAETAEIKARTLERRLRAVCIVVLLGALLLGLLHGGDLIGHLPAALP